MVKKASLDTLPDDILYLVLENLATARDRAHLSRICRHLHRFMQERGWRAFALHCFPTISQQVGEAIDNDDDDEDEDKGDDGNDNDGRRACGTRGWNALAESLTWQSRAWDRRSFSFQALLPRYRRVGPRQRPSRPYRPSLAVHFQADLASSRKARGRSADGEELLVWGAGEDIVARYRGRGGQTRRTGTASAAPVWHVVDGKAAGFRPGYDDVRAISVIEDVMGRPRHRGVLAGRESGDLSLLSAEKDAGFGRLLARFLPNRSDGDDKNQSVDDLAVAAARRPIDQSRIYTVDVTTNGRNVSRLGGGSSNGLVAVTTASHIVFYPLPRDDVDSTPANAAGNSIHKRGGVAESGGDGDGDGDLDDETAVDTAPQRVFPVTTFDMDKFGLSSRGHRHSYNARWLAAEGMLAVGLGVGEQPLRYLTVTPTGPVLTAAHKNAVLAEHYQLTDTSYLLPTSLEPIGTPSSGAGGGGHLVLSAWRDGTCRLQDLRTASPWDLVYQDNVMPKECSQALLVYDGDRFLAGNQESATLKVFDLRWPRRYYHTAALACGSTRSYPLDGILPMRPRTTTTTTKQRLLWPSVPPPLPRRARCCLQRGLECRWHASSKRLDHRPNCNVYLDRALRNVVRHDLGVWALARAASSDPLAPNFYAGLHGCIVEGALMEDTPPDTTAATAGPPRRQGDPHFGYDAASFGLENDDIDYYVPEDVDKTAPYRAVNLRASLMETGDGLADIDAGNRPLMMPLVRSSCVMTPSTTGMSANGSSDGTPGSTSGAAAAPTKRQSYLRDPTGTEFAIERGRMRGLMQTPYEWRRRHRLDYRFQYPSDFGVLREDT
ncbi:f-box domain containing protein [Niveomyces insectorum RCEF 264]|uniref:F-box domain containing protein n=1 Tax=Niveomyces insectorum RCEF 264 TaxID=1081102 RepID=A0A167ZYS1_9HYPO|nr:f-box domain containing protein [Niveomyces insectorum RCEF 264]